MQRMKIIVLLLSVCVLSSVSFAQNSDRKSSLAKAKACQKRGGVWLDDLCVVDIEEDSSDVSEEVNQKSKQGHYGDGSLIDFFYYPEGKTSVAISVMGRSESGKAVLIGEELFHQVNLTTETGLALTYTPTTTSKVYLGAGYLIKMIRRTDYKDSSLDDEKVASSGISDPNFGFQYLILDQKNHSINLEMNILYSPELGNNISAVEDKEGNNLRGGDLLSLGLQVGKNRINDRLSAMVSVGFSKYGTAASHNLEKQSQVSVIQEYSSTEASVAGLLHLKEDVNVGIEYTRLFIKNYDIDNGVDIIKIRSGEAYSLGFDLNFLASNEQMLQLGYIYRSFYKETVEQYVNVDMKTTGHRYSMTWTVLF